MTSALRRTSCWLLAVAGVLAACLLTASAASAQSPTTIEAVDAPGPAWQPANVTVAKGSTVRWEFDQAAAPHTLTSSSANWSVDETRNPGGAAIERTFSAPGVYTFLCKLHGGMTGSVTVKDDPRFDVLVFTKTVGAHFHDDSIAQGKAAIAQMGVDQNFNVTASEDAALFTDAGLRPYEVVVMLNTDGQGVLNASQRTAFERWLQRGKGLVGIHAASNTDRDWEWMTDLRGGSLFLNHPAAPIQFQNATVQIVDPNHPATQGIPTNWVRNDEWYNHTVEPQNVHVLAKLDESSYVEQDGSDGVDDDHPIVWCSNFDRGRAFYTALGHLGEAWLEPLYRQHILGAIEWASGKAAGDCGAPRDGIPTDASFDKVTLDDNTENPMEIAIAPGGNVFYVELGGRVKYYNATTRSTRVVGTIPVHRGNENGLLGITLDPNFATNQWLYLFYSAPTPEEQHVSRFTVGADGNLDMSSEKILLRIPHQRIVCCHSSGSLTFGPNGDLYISTGDDNEHAASQGYAPLDDDVLRDNPGDNPDADRAYDSRRTSGNTNDLRGKILRIRPQPDGTYTIPPGNLYGLGGKYAGVAGQTRPEIYTMGHRNPFRIQVDQETGWLYNGEVGPDATSENANRGPRGYDELNQIREAGNMGWPFCIADNKPYREWTFPSGPAGAPFDCSGTPGGGPVNTSAYNTGLTQTPPTTGALLWWPYQPHANAPGFPWATAPNVIPEGSGRTAIAGPIYHYDAGLVSDNKLPAYYDDKVFFADWSRDWIATLTLDAAGKPAGIRRFMPNGDFRHPHDIEMGPDGALYVLEWGRDFNYAGSGINPDSGLYRIDFVKGARSPVAKAAVDRDSGGTPLTVNFSSAGSEDPDGDPLTYEWDFGDGTAKSAEANPQHTYTEAGVYSAQLKVTDTSGKSAAASVVVTAGNTRPTVSLDVAQGGVYGWGDRIAYTVGVTDPEDGTIDCDRVTVSPGILHDEGGNAHVHPGVSQTGCTGTIAVEQESGHAKSAIIALVLTATYTDRGAAGSQPLEGASTRRLNPKVTQAEHFTAQSGATVVDSPSAQGGRRVSTLDPGDWVYFEPFSLKRVTSLGIRYASTGAGGLVELRLDSPTGPVVGTADLTASGGTTVYRTASAAITAPDDAPHKLYLVAAARAGGPTTSLFDLDELMLSGRGVASDAAPEVSASADIVTGGAPMRVVFTGNAVDPDGTALTYAWDFNSDGTTDATTKDATFTYNAIGSYTATFKATDATGRFQTATIDVEATAPVASCPGDDEFSGTSLDRSIWSTVVREDAAFLNVGGGSLNITSQPFDIHAATTGLRNIVQQPLPVSGPWTATARITWDPTQNYQNAGLMVYDADNRFIKAGMVWADGRRFEAFKELNNVPAGLGSTAVLPASFPTTWQLRLTSNGTSIQAAYSADGVTWTNYGNATNLTNFVAPTVGVYATTSTNAGATNREMKVDWFKLSSPQAPSDEFDRSTLNLCRWTDIVRHEPAGYSVADGKLTLPAAHGDFFAAGANNNPNIILQPAPAGPWTATTRLTFNPNENYEQAGLLVYGDDANYVKADYVHASGRGLEFLREANDVAAGFGGFVGIGTRPTTVDLRIVSDGTTLRAYYRFAGGDWTPYGEPAALASVPNPKVGIYANDSNATVATRDNAVFDFFRLAAGPPDTTPPDTTHTLSPAAPDGQNGWYRSDVTLTLSTESGTTTQYRIGTGAFQDYTGPVTLGQEGTTTVAYRSTDAEGNVEADKSVTVKLDSSAPTSTATLDPATPGTGPVTVTLAATDPAGGSGVDRIQYRLDGGDWTTYAQPLTVSGAGQHTVEHWAADAAGNIGATTTTTFTIQPSEDPGAPTVDAFADPASGAAPLRVNFTAAGLDPDGGSVTYKWVFADGEAFGDSVSRVLRTQGTHTATVTVTDDEGDTATDSVSVTVTGAANEPPVIREASADRVSGPAPLEVWFQAVADDSDGGQLTYRWEFGDGPGSALGAEAAHTYGTPGTFTARVTVTDAAGASDTETIAITVANAPGNQAPSVAAAAVPASGRVPLDVTFTAQGSDPDGDALSYSWEFGDGSAAVKGRRARHVYTKTGTFTATVTATDKAGNSDTATVAVVVGDPPANQAPTVQAAADPAGSTAPLTVSFSAAASDPDGDAVSYVWDFGDGNKSGGAQATHTFTAAGSYTVTVTATDVKGNKGTATLTVVAAAPQQIAAAAPAAPAAKAAIVSVQSATVASFARRGLTAMVQCGGAGTAEASLWVSRATARRLGLASRRLGARTVGCAAGGTVAVRVKPARKARRRLAGRKGSLTVVFRLAPGGAAAIQRSTTLRAGR